MSGDAAQRGRIFLHRGDLAQARQCYEQAVAQARAETDPRGLPDSLGNLGNVCAMLGDRETAERCYREVLALQRERKDQTAIGQTLTNLGNLHADAGQAERARSYYLEACDLLEAAQDQRALGILYSNLALQDAALGRPGAAVEIFKKALDLHRAVGNEEGLAVTYGQLGKTCLSAGLARQAERCLNNACEHFIKLGDGLGEAGALRLLADLYEGDENWLSAIRCLERVRQIGLMHQLQTSEADRARLDRLRRRTAPC
jgi:tetratricopeptide (TPR) repeat protein